MSKRVLIIGGESVIGAALACELRGVGAELLTTTRRPTTEDGSILRLDLSEPVSDWPLPRCDAAVLCTGVGSLETCRRDPIGTRKINVEHSGTLCRRLMDAGALVVMLSTNMVYDGSVPLVVCNAPPCPATEYGRQKAALERVLLREPEQAAVVRLTKVFQPGLPLLKRWIAAMRAGEGVDAFMDYVCSPIHLSTVVAGLRQIIAQRLGGIWQFSAPDDISYAEIANRLAVSLGLSRSLVHETVCDSGMEHVPRHATLDARRAHEELGIKFDPSAVTLTKLFA